VTPDSIELRGSRLPQRLKPDRLAVVTARLKSCSSRASGHKQPLYIGVGRANAPAAPTRSLFAGFEGFPVGVGEGAAEGGEFAGALQEFTAVHANDFSVDVRRAVAYQECGEIG